ncbi:MAG TPA: type II secretion system secretin GspD [Gallionella sp.]
MQKPSARLILNAMLILCCIMASIQPAHAQANQGKQPAGSTLNFVNADIESVIAAIGDYTNTTFVIDPRVKGTISLVSEKPLSKAQAFKLLTSVLRMNGYSVVAGSGYSKVVPEADAKLQAGPMQSGRQTALRGDQIATQVFKLNYETANNLVAVLRPLISPNNTINANPGNNTLVITDYADNLLRLGRIIASIDSPASGEFEVVPVRHAIADDLATMVSRLLEPGGQPGSDAGRITLLTDSRSNSIIVRAPSRARASQAKSLIEQFDQPTEHPGNVHVVYLKNAEATKLAETLRAVMTADPSALSAQSASRTGKPQSTQQPPASAPAGGSGGFIQADPTTNTLIITASEPVYRNLRAIIDQLDARRAQVYIESMIVEVSASRAAEFGVQWSAATGDTTSDYRIGGLTSFGTGGDNLVNQGIARAGGSYLPLGSGLSLGVLRQVNGQVGLGALARALATDGDANILSMPNLITLDNEEAKIIVGQNVPFVTGQYTTSASGGAAGVNPFQTIERKDIGLSLRVRPQISEGGTVKMTIYQETSSVHDLTGAAGITTNKRSIDTNVLVDDGQIIVLGGLIDDQETENVSKVPLLGDIPIIGNLFKYQNRKRVKTNLMVFLRPTVIRSTMQSTNLASDRYNFIRNSEIEVQPKFKLTLPNTGAPLLPELKDGQMDGGLLFNRMDNGELFPPPAPSADAAAKASKPDKTPSENAPSSDPASDAPEPEAPASNDPAAGAQTAGPHDTATPQATE